MTKGIMAGIWARVCQRVNEARLTGHHSFSAAGTAVGLWAHPAITDLVQRHLHYASEPSSGLRWRVSVVQDRRAWEQLEMSPIGWSPCLDYGELGLRWHQADAYLVASLAGRYAAAIDRQNRDVAIVAADPAGAFQASYKATRFLITDGAFASGYASLHASAMELGGGCVAFVGRKGAGKSTAALLCLLARPQSARYLANDRVLVSTGDVQPGCIPWPTVAGFGREALRAYGFDQSLSADFHRRQGPEAFMLADLPLFDGSLDSCAGERAPKLYVTPAEMEGLFGLPASNGGSLTAVVQTELNMDAPATTVTAIDRQADREAVAMENLESALKNHPSWFTSGWPQWSHESRCRMASKLAATDTCVWYRVALGKDARDVLPGVVLDLLARKSPDSNVHYHTGVYGVLRRGSDVLLVRKARGPYTGLLDLPGGRPSAGESRDVTLHREMQEEIACRVHRTSDWREFQVDYPYSRSGRTVRFIHQGTWATVATSDGLDLRICEEDVAGAEFISLDSVAGRDDLSPAATMVLRNLS